MAENVAEFLKYHQNQLSKVIDFFCAAYFNPKFERDKICFGEEKSNDTDLPNYEFLITSGWFSLEDYYDYNFSREIIKYDVIEPLMEILCNHSILIYQTSKTGLRFYKPNSTYFQKCPNIQYIYNHLFGFGYIIDSYEEAVFKIEVSDKRGDVSLGTGFLIEHIGRHFIVTNKHVIEGFELNLLNIQNQALEFKEVFTSEHTDIAVIELAHPLTTRTFLFNVDMKILDSIITMGYPIVPMTRDAYLLCHTGEINSFIHHYNGQEYFIVSAKTSSGNSGSPVIDHHGQVLGMITEELFEESQFFSKGKLPYYAAIPSSDIIKFIESL